MTCRARFNSNLFINRFATNITAKRRFLIKDNWTSNFRSRIQFPFGFWQFFERWPEVPHFQQWLHGLISYEMQFWQADRFQDPLLFVAPLACGLASLIYFISAYNVFKSSFIRLVWWVYPCQRIWFTCSPARFLQLMLFPFPKSMSDLGHFLVCLGRVQYYFLPHYPPLFSFRGDQLPSFHCFPPTSIYYPPLCEDFKKIRTPWPLPTPQSDWT